MVGRERREFLKHLKSCYIEETCSGPKRNTFHPLRAVQTNFGSLRRQESSLSAKVIKTLNTITSCASSRASVMCSNLGLCLHVKSVKDGPQTQEG